MQHDKDRDAVPEQVERCVVVLQRNGYVVKERRYGWLVMEPLGGRQRIASADDLTAYTARVVRKVEQSASRCEAQGAAADDHAVESVAGTSNMTYGAICAIVGLIITAVTYEAAGEGETYVVAYGAIASGVVLFVAGLFQRLTHKKSAGRGSGRANRR